MNWWEGYSSRYKFLGLDPEIEEILYHDIKLAKFFDSVCDVIWKNKYDESIIPMCAKYICNDVRGLLNEYA